MNAQNVNNDLINFYGSARKPNFQKVNLVYESKPYSEIINLLFRISNNLEEFTELQTDVSFRYSFSLEGNINYSIAFSFVGKYYIFVRIESQEKHFLIDDLKKTKNESEKNVLDMLNNKGFFTFSLKELKTTILFDLWDDKKPTLYRLLFADDYYLDYLK